MQYIISLNSSGIKKICDLPDSVCSISFCNTLNSIFFSDIERNSIYTSDLNGKIETWRNGDLENPKGICMDEKHNRVFFEDNKNAFDGCWIKSQNYFSSLSKPSTNWLRPMQSKRAYSLEKFQRIRHFCFCDYIKNIVFTVGSKNIVVAIDNSGNHKTIIGSGRKDFSISSNCLSLSMNNPTGITYLSLLKEIVVSDTSNHVLRRFDVKEKMKEKEIIGSPVKHGNNDGTFSNSSFSFPSETCSYNNHLYVLDGEESTMVRKIDMKNKTVKTAYETKNFISSISCSDDSLFLLERI